MAVYVSLDKKMEAEIIKDKCQKLLEVVDAKTTELLSALTEYESYETAEDEIWRSKDYLQNISEELKWLTHGKVDSMCAFFPVNLPLYSLFLFAIVPGFMSGEVVIRVPLLMRSVAYRLMSILELEKIVPNIKVVDLERSLFVEAYVSNADIVLFTGRYSNALLVQAACRGLFIYNGAGINPFLITKSADINDAVHKSVEMRLFNSGQDCAGPDAFLVDEAIINSYKNNLVKMLGKVKIGSYSNPEVRVGSLVKADHLKNLRTFLESKAENLEYGGKIDFEQSVVYPTVIVEDISVMTHAQTMEFFAPVFYVLVYSNIQQVSKFFLSKHYKDYAMYVSIFGQTPPSLKIPNSTILRDKIVNDVERGYIPYGGRGKKANYIFSDNKYMYKPLQISKEIKDYISKKTKAK